MKLFLRKSLCDNFHFSQSRLGGKPHIFKIKMMKICLKNYSLQHREIFTTKFKYQ